MITLTPLAGGHGGHTLQVVTGIARISLKKIIPRSHGHNGLGRGDGSASQRES
jgi:hypothetical protein